MTGTKTSTSPVLAGCELLVLDSAACEPYLAWLLGEGEAVAPAGTALNWALAHCDDGVTWGRFDAETKVWRLGNQVAPSVSPPIRRESLQELRLFGDTSEVLIWRTEGELRGRVIRDSSPAADPGDASNPLCPSNESRILRGERVVARHEHDFTHVGDRTGAEQVLPLAVTPEQLRAGQVRLAVCHYYELAVRHHYQSDEEAGAVRIAATRLVTVTCGGSHGS